MGWEQTLPTWDPKNHCKRKVGCSLINSSYSIFPTNKINWDTVLRLVLSTRGVIWGTFSLVQIWLSKWKLLIDPSRLKEHSYNYSTYSIICAYNIYAFNTFKLNPTKSSWYFWPAVFVWCSRLSVRRHCTSVFKHGSLFQAALYSYLFSHIFVHLI